MPNDSSRPQSSVAGVRFYTLTKAAAKLVSPLTFKHLKRIVANFDPEQHVAIVAVRDQEGFPDPIGLAFGMHRREASTAYLKSVVVRPEARRRGVATALLRKWEATAADRGADRASTQFMDHLESADIVEKLLSSRGWSPPEREHVLYKSAGDDFQRFAEAEWIHGSWMRPPFQLFPWADLSTEEQEAIQQDFENHPAYDQTLVPIPQVARDMDLKTSVGLRRDEDIVGWMVNTHVERTVVFDHLYVHPPHRRLARGVALIAGAIRLALEHRDTLYWITDSDNTEMIQFSERRMGPFVTESYDVYSSETSLEAT